MNGKHNVRTAPSFIAMTILLLVSSACGSGTSPTLVATSAPLEDSGSQEQPTQAPTSTPVTQQNYKIGDVVTIGNGVLFALGWENVQARDFIKPEDGKKFIAVELIVVNNSQSAIRIDTSRQASVEDNTGQTYDSDFDSFVAVGSASIDGELVPGEKVQGKVGFQVPENVQSLQFVFDASAFGSDKVKVDLGAEPVTIEPPADLAGETSLQTYDVSDAIAIGTTTLTVNDVQYPTSYQSSEPTAGFKFLVVDLTIENKGSEAILFSVLDQPSLKDASGQTYFAQFSPNVEIAPGEEHRGQVGFSVPENAADFVFIFDARSWDSDKVFVALP